MTPTYRFERQRARLVADWCTKNPSKTSIILRLGTVGKDDPIPQSLSMHQRQIIMPATAAEYARQMYAALRHADRQNPAIIWLEIPPDEAQWAAVRDRLLRGRSRLSPQ